MNFDEELAKAAKEMDDAEDALAKLGFPEVQWMLIKGYVLAAITHNQVVVAKALQEHALSELNK
jgi:hypothetical protein